MAEAFKDALNDTFMSDFDQRLADMQQLLLQEMQVRAAADDALSRQIAQLPPIESVPSKGVENNAWIRDELAELKLLLAAEVDARCAVVQRLDQSFSKVQASIDQNSQTCADTQKELRSLRCSTPGMNSAQGGMGLHPSLEDKVQMSLDGLSQKLESTNLQMGIFRENVNAVAAEANKHIEWVKSQIETNAAKQDVLEKALHEMRLNLSSSGQHMSKLQGDVSSLSKLLTDHGEPRSSASSSQGGRHYELQKVFTDLRDSCTDAERTWQTIESIDKKLSDDWVANTDKNLEMLRAMNRMKDKGRHSEPVSGALASQLYPDRARCSEPLSQHPASRAQSSATSAGQGMHQLLPNVEELLENREPSSRHPSSRAQLSATGAGQGAPQRVHRVLANVEELG